MDRADLLDRVQKLIALALHNPNEQEARSAALKACQLIEEHGLLTGPPAPAPVPMVPRTPWKTDDAYEPFLEFWKVQRHRYEQRRRYESYADPFKPPE